jgi:hypothetical protein
VVNSSNELPQQAGDTNISDAIGRIREKKTAFSPTTRQRAAIRETQGIIRSAAQSGGASIAGSVGSVAGDVVGGHKITIVNTRTFTTGIDTEITAGFVEPNNDVIQRLESIKGDVARLRSADERLKLNVAQIEAEMRCKEGRPEDASRIFMEALEREDRAEQQRLEDHRRFRVRLLEEAIAYDRKASQADAASTKLRMVAEVVYPADRKAQAQYLYERATQYREHGQLKGDNAALLVALSISLWLAKDSIDVSRA